MLSGDRYSNKGKFDFRLLRELDKGLLFTMLILVIYGIINIYIVTKGGVFQTLGPFYFAKKQIISFLLSLVILGIFLAVDYRLLYRYAPIVYWIGVILLIMVWIPGLGVEVNGARGWINIGITKFQPAEIAKFGIILMVAKLIDDMEGDLNTFKNLSKIVIYAIIPVAFILIQKDMGMTMVCFFIVLGMLYIGGLDKRIISGGFLILFVSIIVLWNSGLILYHQKARLIAFMSPETDDSNQGYQLSQSLIGIGAGGISGIRTNLDPDISPGYAATHVPEIQTDFIFAGLSEQWGLIGGLFLLVLYGILIVKMINIARKSRDKFGTMVCIGIVSYFLFAITQNIGMTIGLLPITGITLPLISYGGTSLLTTIISVAAVLSVGMRKRKIHF